MWKPPLPLTALPCAPRGLHQVKVKKGEDKKRSWTSKAILKGIDGIIQPGRTTAVMGASGAGKTTYLNVLVGRGGGRDNQPGGGPYPKGCGLAPWPAVRHEPASWSRALPVLAPVSRDTALYP